MYGMEDFIKTLLIVEKVKDPIILIQIDQVRQVERLRQAIMENLNVEFPRPHLSSAAMFSQYPQGQGQPGQFQGQHPGQQFPYQGHNGGGGILPPPNSFARGMRPAGMGGIPAGMSHHNQNMMPKQHGRGRGILGTNHFYKLIILGYMKVTFIKNVVVFCFPCLTPSKTICTLLELLICSIPNSCAGCYDNFIPCMLL